MRKRCLLVFAVFSVVLIMTSPVFCYNIGGINVGGLDNIIGSADLGNSGYQSELQWTQNLLSSLYGGDLSDYWFPENSDINGWSGFTLVDGEDPNNPDVYGLDFAQYLTNYPAFYFIKYGDGGIPGLNSHQMYENIVELQWAVISLNAVSTALNFDIQRVSHIQGTQGQPVPEPTTMLLLGSGLIGLAGLGRKKLKK